METNQINSGKLQATKVELVSLHIPKTAGTSFRNTLKAVYGEKEVIRFDINHGAIEVNERPYTATALPAHVKVLHGHFSYRELMNKVELSPSVPIITWLRHPVKRVVSNYFYLASIMAKLMDEERNHVDILSKMQRSLPEYAAAELNRNRMSRFLEGINLESLNFIGVVEHFEEDMQKLAGLLSWKKHPVFHYNNTGEQKADKVDEQVLKDIAAWNEADMDLYNRALALRARALR